MTRGIERKLAMPNFSVSPRAAPELKQFAKDMVAAHKALLEAHNLRDDDMMAAQRGGTSSKNNGLEVYRELDVTMPLDAPWHDLTPVGGWANVAGWQAAQVLMEPGGHVSTRGVVDSGASGTLAVAPGDGYGPPADQLLPCGSDAAAVMRLLANTGGLRITGAGTLFSIAAQWIAAPAPGAGILTVRPHAFTGLGWPLIVNHGFDKALNCEVVGCRESSGPVGAPVPDWEDIGSGQLRLNGLWGLQWGRRYAVRLRISKEA